MQVENAQLHRRGAAATCAASQTLTLRKLMSQWLYLLQDEYVGADRALNENVTVILWSVGFWTCF